MKVNKIIIITAGLFILFGVIISGIAVMLTAKSSERNARMETKEITENISKINISVDMSDVKIIPANTDKITLTYFTDETNQYDISTDNGTLSVEYVRFSKEKVKWYDYYFSFDFGRDHDIILEVPRNFRADIQLSANYGDIEVTGVNGGGMNVQTDYGDVEIKDCKFTSIECTTDYGDIDMEQCGSDTFNCNTDYGDIEFERISGKNIVFDTACGDIEGTIDGSKSDYMINTETSLGKRNIQNKTDGKNTLDAKTDLGDIEISFLR